MNIYTIYLNSRKDNIEPVIVKDGFFSLTAAIFSLFWALHHKMWGVIIFMIFIHLSLPGLQEYTSFNIVSFVQLLTILIFGFFASDLRDHYLQKQSYRLQDIVLSNSELEAELRFFKKMASPTQNPDKNN